jgi:hypothetical protein
VRGSVRIPTHHPVPVARDVRDTDDEDRFIGRTCYVFNSSLQEGLNDTRCAHCRFYLTARCPHIDEFLDDVEDLMPE